MVKKPPSEPKLHFKYHEDNTPAPPGWIFVFGSNLAGFHGRGAAWAAREYYGAKLGVSEGLTGRSYAIPTKDENIQTREMEGIIESIARFVLFTIKNPDKMFFVTRVGCGLAGLKDEDIAPIFFEAQNCSFAEQWKPHLESMFDNTEVPS